MPGTGPRQFNCLVCSKRTKPRNRRRITAAMKRCLAKKFLIQATDEDVICDKCRQKYCASNSTTQTEKKDTTCSAPAENQDPEWTSKPANSSLPKSPPSVTLNMKSTPRSHARCAICKKPGPKLINISAEARYNAFIQKNVLIAAGNRCCPGHLITDGHIKPECMDTMTTTDHAMVNRTSIVKLLAQMREDCIQKGKCVQFDSMNNADCKTMTGLSRIQLDDLCTHVCPKIKATPVRSPQASVGTFLFKLKSGISNKLLSTILKISCSSVRRAVKTVRAAMMSSFVPLYLGLEAITREELILHHTRPLATQLFDVEEGAVILILDGTYIYVQKSNNFSFQRQSFSLHKSRPLVKPMVVVSTTGHYVTIVGPYLAKDNDARILNHMINSNVQEFRDYIQEKDLLVVDRGFRDSLSLLEELGVRAAMPTFLAKGEKQMSTEDGNTSRLVTKIRWVVESANARIKRYKYLDKVLPTNQVPYIGDYVRIVCALSNKYLPQLSSSHQQEEDAVLAAHMKERAQQVNQLRSYVEENHLDRGFVSWKAVEDCDLCDFPRLEEAQLRGLTCGVYQLRLSPSYIQEHMDGESDIQVHKVDANLLRVRIQSRHVSSKKYFLWIRYDESSVLSWYCKCRAGSRVVGVCAHIAAVIWYLSKGRHQTGQLGVQDWGAYMSDAVVPETVDSSDSDESCCSTFEE